MAAPRRQICLVCQYRSLISSLKLPSYPPWQIVRSVAQLERRPPPARMALSPTVSSPSVQNKPSGKPTLGRPSGPWAATNLTHATVRREPRGRSEAQLKRSSGARERPRREKREQGPFKALKMQRALTAISYAHRNSVKESIRETEGFDEFPLLPVVKESITAQALLGMENISPTPIQRLAIPELMGQTSRSKRGRLHKAQSEGPEQFLLAAETGSGKTLAYLLPVLDAIKRMEVDDAKMEAEYRAAEEEKKKKSSSPSYLEPPPLSNQPHSTTGRPRAIILVPTSELVVQVGKLVKSLSHTIKIRSSHISSADTGRVIRNKLFAPTGINVLTSTPHLLASIAESDPNILSRVTQLVIDEADSLLDRSFAPSTSAIVDKATPSLRQLILCSATIPRSLDSYLQKRFPDMRRLTTPNLHAIPRRVQLGVVDIDKEPYRGNRNLACADAIWSIGKSAAEHVISPTPGKTEVEKVAMKRILVFVNEREKTLEVAEYLNSKGIDAVALNRDTVEQRQTDVLGTFTTSAFETVPVDTSSANPSSNESIYKAANHSSGLSLGVSTPSRRRLANTKVLVATDLGSRGIDTLAVRHVILYDVPHSTIDFIHRLGRTGRMGRRGRGIVLVGKGDRRDVVSEVKEGMFRGQALI